MQNCKGVGWDPAPGSGESPHWAEAGQAPPFHRTAPLPSSLPTRPHAFIPRPCWVPTPAAGTSKPGFRSEPSLGARGSSKGLACLLPTAGSNWFGQGAASADCIPGPRASSRFQAFPGRAWGAWAGPLGAKPEGGSILRETRPCANSALCLKPFLWPWAESLAQGGTR